MKMKNKVARGLGLAMVQTLLFLGLLVTGGATLAAEGGLPGTGDLEFDPASDTEGNQCRPGVPSFSNNWNAFYEVSEAIVFSPQPPRPARGEVCTRSNFRCRFVNSGEFYIPLTSWVTNQTGGILGFPEVYPSDYTPTMSPRDDFRSKVDMVKYVIDPGTRHEKILKYPAENVMWRDDELVSDTVPAPFSNPLGPAAKTTFLAKLHPEEVGKDGCNVMEMYLIMEERHCDGLGTGPGSCLQPGENFNGRQFFEVQAGAVQSQ